LQCPRYTSYTRTMKTHVPDNLRRLRTAAGLTQADLAHLARVHRVTVNKIEAGTYSTQALPTLQRLAKALRVGVGELLEAPRKAGA